MNNQIKTRVIGYTVCWERPDPMGFGSTEYGVIYPKTEEDAFSLIKESGRDTLKRTVKVMCNDRSGKFWCRGITLTRKNGRRAHGMRRLR